MLFKKKYKRLTLNAFNSFHITALLNIDRLDKQSIDHPHEVFLPRPITENLNYTYM